MAGLGRKVFTRERLTSADVNGYLMDQAIPVFANVAARDAAITSPADGMHCWVTDPGRMWRYRSGIWWYAGGVSPDYAPLTVPSGWAAVSNRAPGVFLDASGCAQLEGAMTNNGAFTPPSTTLFTLDTPYRPRRLVNYPVGAGSASGMVNVEVATTGVVRIVAPATQLAASTTVSFDAIRFRAQPV